MCGIAGSISHSDGMYIKAATRRLAHRGPDAEAHHIQTLDDGRILALGHRRLSIVDLSETANQPFASASGRYRMVYNGEIYNWRALRAELVALGADFRTQSDTEVLLNAFQVWGADCLKRFDGMFAFAIWDERKQELFVARDPFGIKPLYYYHDRAKKSFFFASEIDALLCLTGQSGDADPAAFGEFLLNGFLYEPQTGIVGILKLAPGTAGVFHAQSGEFETSLYDTPLLECDDHELTSLIEESMELQSCADVPVGLFFSGGLDSTVLAAAYPGHLTGLMMDYSADPSDVGIDQQYARKIAEALNFPLLMEHERDAQTDANETLADFAAVAAGSDEPISDFTYIATRKLSRLARDRGFKVMLSGMGGDELFAGYPRMRLARRYREIRRGGPAMRLLLKTAGSLPGMEKRAARLMGFAEGSDLGEAYTRLVGYFSLDEVEGLLDTRVREEYLHDMAARLEPVREHSPLKQAMYLDRLGFLSHNLTITDRASMAENIEVRVPLITTKLAAWATAQQDSQLIQGADTKLPLRRFARSRLPQNLIDRPKQGFNPPLDHRIAALGADRIMESVRDAALFDHVDEAMVTGLVRSHFEGRSNETYRLWQLTYFALWLRQRQEKRLMNAAYRKAA